MNLSSNTVLVTGGASGIGMALAERFLKAGSRVIVCGRREEILKEFKSKNPEAEVFACDVSEAKGRIALLERVRKDFPDTNVLVNNAGIQRRLNLAEQEDWEVTRSEIAVNLDAPVHLSRIFIPHLLKQKSPAIINITSGLSFVPLTMVPVYCATKAALHSFTLSLRHQLADTPISVIEVIPPAVQTDLGGKGHHDFGVPLDEFADAVMGPLGKGDLEIPYGFSAASSRASRDELDKIFLQLNQKK